MTHSNVFIDLTATDTLPETVYLPGQCHCLYINLEMMSIQHSHFILHLKLADCSFVRDDLRGFAKLKKNSKKNLEVGGWVQVPFGLKQKLSKNKVLRLYNSTLLGGACGTSRCACMQHLSRIL